MNSLLKSVSSLILLSGFFSCVHTQDIVMVTNVENEGWTKDGPVYVWYGNEDTVSQRTLLLVSRFTDRFGYDKLRLAVEMLSPEGKFHTDTVFVKYDPAWKNASGPVTHKNSENIFRTGVVLRETGKYRIRFSHLMPDSVIQGVSGLGIRIEK